MQDLFVVRASNKPTDANKDVETQREVLTATLLKFSRHFQVGRASRKVVTHQILCCVSVQRILVCYLRCSNCSSSCCTTTDATAKRSGSASRAKSPTGLALKRTVHINLDDLLLLLHMIVHGCIQSYM